MELTPSRAEKVLNQVGLPAPSDREVLNKGISVHKAWRVTTPQGMFVIKPFSYWGIPDIDYARAQLKYALIDHLSSGSTGFPYQVTRYLSTPEGERSIVVDGSVFEVYPWIEGERSREQTPAQREEQAIALAKYHRAVEGRDFGYQELQQKDISRTIVKWDQFQEGETIISNTRIREILTEHTSAWQKLSEEAARLSGQKLRGFMLLHTDFHPGNLVYRGQNLIGVIDFDNVRYGSPLMDIAYALPPNENYREFLTAYESVRPLSATESALVLPLKAERCLSHALSFTTTKENNPEREELFENVARKYARFADMLEQEVSSPPKQSI